MNAPYDALVIGAGINGLSTLYHLSRLGCKHLGLIERFSLGHNRGSSHGHSRVTRTAYVDVRYVRLMQVVNDQEWPRLERDAGIPLVHRTSGCFFGPPGGKQEAYAKAAREAGVPINELNATEAARHFPLFRFNANDRILHDHTAGLVAAANTLSALVRITQKNNVDLMDNTQVQKINFTSDPIQLITDRGTLFTKRLVVTTGSWTGTLLPFLKPRLQVARQTVGYFKLQGDPELFRPANFPVWGNLGAPRDGVHYGLPEFGRPGLKVAHHVTEGRNDDPEQHPDPSPQDIAHLRSFMAQQFTAPVKEFLGAETCLYTNTETEDFILDLHPENPNIAIGAGFSGHGFKLGPLTGRILAELALNGKTTIPEFEAARSLFSINR